MIFIRLDRVAHKTDTETINDTTVSEAKIHSIVALRH